MLQGDVRRSDAFTIAQLAVMRMFDNTLPPLTANIELGNFKVSKIERHAHQPDQIYAVHSKPLEARFMTAEASEATIDTTSFPYGSVGALGSLAVGPKPEDWDDNAADMSFETFSQGLGDIELNAKMNSNGLFVSKSFLEIVKGS